MSAAGRTRGSSLSPETVLGYFTPQRLKKNVWPAWIMVDWEEGYIFRRWLTQLWETLLAQDRDAERVVHYPVNAAGVAALHEDIGAPSLFSATRLLIAHLSRSSAKMLRPETLAERLSAMPSQTVLVLAAEGMGWTRETAAKLRKAYGEQASPQARPQARPGYDVSIWKPFPEKLEQMARGILSVCGVRPDSSETLKFWLDRVGGNLDRLQTEAARMKLLSKDGEVTEQLIEEVFEDPHVNDQTLWVGLKAVLGGDTARAAAELERLLQSSDPQAVSARLAQPILCIQALARGGEPEEDVFRKFNIKAGKRYRQILLDCARLLTKPLPRPASRLLALDLDLKQSKTAASRQEGLLRNLLTLCGDLEPSA